MVNPIRPTSDDARQIARSLLANARFAALAVMTQTGNQPPDPLVTRISFGLGPQEHVASNRIRQPSRTHLHPQTLPRPGTRIRESSQTRHALGQPVSLVSDLSLHTRALSGNPACSLLVGEPGPRGDPLTHPRLTLRATAQFLRHDDPGHAEMATHYLRSHPKAKLYIGFADFSFVLFTVRQGHLNGGFGEAFTLTPADLGQEM